jgi:integrase
MMSLSDFARRYVLRRDVSPIYAGTLTRRAIALENFAGESTIARVLVEEIVNAFLASLERISAWTVKGYRGDILSLWNAAADEDLVPYPVPRRIRRPRVPALIVDCYDIEEARALVAAAEVMAGHYNSGIPRKLYWEAAIRLAWATGLRRGDVWAFRRDAVRSDLTMRVVQHKTGELVVCRLTPKALIAIDRIGLNQPLAWHHRAWTFGLHFKEITRASGVNRGTFKFLRRSSGSYVEAIQPGAGHKHLGHADPGVFAKHYDARLGASKLPLPPEL